MLNESSVCSQRLGIKSTREPFSPDEAIVDFENFNQIKSFFDVAMRSRRNTDSIKHIEKVISPSYCCRSFCYPPVLE